MPLPDANRPLAVFLPSLRGGGAERVALNLVREFDRLGLPVELLLAQAQGPYLAQVPASVRVIDLGCRRVLHALPKLRRYLRDRRPVAVLSTLANANVVLAWAHRWARSPARLVLREPNTVTLAAAHPRNWRERLLPWFIARFYPWAHTVVVNSDGSARDLVEGVGLPVAKVRVIPNPVDLAAIRTAAREPSPVPVEGSGPLLVTAGRLTRQKGFGDLLQALRRVREERPARLVILGEGEERDALARLVEALGLAGAVSMPGFCDNPWAVMARADLFVMSSLWEGQPNALMEAVALGVPAVSTDCPSGPRGILRGGRLGGLVPVGDPPALAAAILAALDAPPDRDALRLRAEEFAIERVARAYLEALGVELPPPVPSADEGTR